jgi:hypothetical protein
MWVFLFGASSASGTGDAWRGIPIPGILGLVVGIAVSVLVFRGLVALNVLSLLFYSTLILMAFSAGLIGHAMHEFQELDLFGPYEEVDPLDRDWWNAQLWSLESCCNDEENQFFAMMRALFGWQDAPTFVEVMAYFGYWALIACIMIYAFWPQVRASRSRAASIARNTSAIALLSFFVGFIYAALNATWTGILTTTLGLLISLAAVPVSFDAFSSWLPALKASRRQLALATALAAALLTALIIVLHFAQLSCLEKSCALPQFYYWGLIFGASFNESGNAGTTYNSVSVLTFSVVFSFFFLGAMSLALGLTASNMTTDGDIIYDDHVNLAAASKAADPGYDHAGDSSSLSDTQPQESVTV